MTNWLGLMIGGALIVFPEPATTLTGVAVVLASIGMDDVDPGGTA
jgi:hypothetical protein